MSGQQHMTLTTCWHSICLTSWRISGRIECSNRSDLLWFICNNEAHNVQRQSSFAYKKSTVKSHLLCSRTTVQHDHCNLLIITCWLHVGLWVTVTSNSSPYGTGPLSYLSVTLVYCGQMVGRIKMPLSTEVGLGPGNIVLDGDPALSTERGIAAPTFRPMSIVAKWSPISATAWLQKYGAQSPEDSIA